MILFNASVCGLGNNGGSKTIIESTKVLNKIHTTTRIWAPINNYTWGDSPCVCKRPMYPEVYDHIICVSVWDVDSTINSPIKNKVWWIRGWEKWVYGEDYLKKKILAFNHAGGKIITNSTWLSNHIMDKCGIVSPVCFPGLDLDFWKPTLFRNENLTIGGLWHSKHKTKNYHIFEDVRNRMEGDLYKFVTLKDNLNNLSLRELYNRCDIWLATSELEGFHQVPAEAALCGCLIIYNDIDSGGTRDYCNPDTAVPFRTITDIIEAIKTLDYGYKLKNMQKRLYEIGDRYVNMNKFYNLINEV